MKKSIILFLIVLFNSINCLSQPYIIETPITGLHKPVAFAFLPNNNVIITHKDSLARIYTLNNVRVSVFWTFTDSLNSGFERGVLGVCIDPNFVSNRYVYIYYNHSIPPNSNTNQRVRVVRFTENNNVGTNPLIVFEYLTGTIQGNHVGGNIRFGPDGKLFISIGDNATSSNSQLLTNPRGKIHRINSNGSIPTDNPFYDDGNPNTGNDDRIWAYGLRNSFDFTFSPVNDSIYASENGPNDFDEVNFIRKGKNYGWPICSGYCNPYNPNYKQPMAVWPSPLPAVTGVLGYNSNVMPQFNGRLLVADNDAGQIHNCVLGNAPYFDTVNSRTVAFDLEGLTTLMQGTDGFIYALNGGYTSTGKLYRIKPDNTGINSNQNSPDNFVLHQNFPNPFNPTTKITYSVAKKSFVTLRIFTPLGEELKTLVSEPKNPGTYEVYWDARDFPSGVYFYRLAAGDFTGEKKMVLIK
ncbi:MAG: PQQ-dependent sugar dehydrogenase [Ignavibacteria bacterium]